MKNIFLCIFVFFAHIVYANDIDLLSEYKLLSIDLENLRTWGYKSYYNNELNKADGYINISQGSIQMTEVYSDYAIAGEGFFKIRLDDNSAAYTRAGNFLINSDGNVVTPQGYCLYDNIFLGENFFPESFRITSNHDIYISAVDDNKIIETQLGQLLTYKIPSEYLEYHTEAIYKIKEGIEYLEEVTFDNSIISGSLEMSNCEVLPVVIRMYYILNVLDENSIPNIEFKKELLNILIKYILDSNVNTAEYNNQFNYYIEKISQFIKYDY